MLASTEDTHSSDNVRQVEYWFPQFYYPAWLSMHIALPPLAEQHRIVVKVEELMALCDRSEASLTSAQDHSSRLLDALLAEALSPAEDVLPAELGRVAALG
jgi:hypothetical protein